MDQIVKVIEIQTKKLGANETAVSQTQLLILSKALPQLVAKVNALLLFERMVCTVTRYDRAFLTNLAQIVGLVSKVGGLTKFPAIANEIKLLARRLV